LNKKRHQKNSANKKPTKGRKKKEMLSNRIKIVSVGIKNEEIVEIKVKSVIEASDL
jgi:hypothetical protein